MLKIIIFLLILCAFPAGLFFGPSTMEVDAKQPAVNPISVTLVSERITAQDNIPELNARPEVKYLGTLLLNSPHPAFGGFSDLLVSPDRKMFLAVSDMGFWIRAGLEYSEEGQLTGTSSKALLGQLLDSSGRTYPIKYMGDAEGLSRAPESGYLVSFERISRIHKFSSGGDLSLAGTPTEFPVPAAVTKLPDNSGLESLLLLPDQSVFIMAEGEDKQGPNSYAAIFKDNRWEEFSYARSGDFRPTSAANLSGGRILVLERRYTGPGSLGIRFREFGSKEMKSGASINANQFFEIQPPIPRDNYEGLDTVTTDDGRTYIYIISDDNFSPMQHTLLTLFELDQATIK